MTEYATKDGLIFDAVGALGHACAHEMQFKIAAAMRDGKRFTPEALVFWLEYSGRRLGESDKVVSRLSKRCTVWRETESNLKREIAEASERAKRAEAHVTRLSQKINDLERSRFADPFGETG